MERSFACVNRWLLSVTVDKKKCWSDRQVESGPSHYCSGTTTLLLSCHVHVRRLKIKVEIETESPPVIEPNIMFMRAPPGSRFLF